MSQRSGNEDIRSFKGTYIVIGCAGVKRVLEVCKRKTTVHVGGIGNNKRWAVVKCVWKACKRKTTVQVGG